MSGDTPHTCERGEPTPGPGEGVPGYWRGGAVAEVDAWKQRALAAEAEVQALRKALRRWRWRP